MIVEAQPPATNGAAPGVGATELAMAGMPKTGVQVLDMEERNGVQYFTVRDLRNNSIIHNVTKKSARDLWHYAITQFVEHPNGPNEVDWQGDRAVLSHEMRAGKMRSDLALRDAGGKVLVFYGVTDHGLDADWKTLISAHAPASESHPPSDAALVEQPVGDTPLDAPAE
jgi:hypothetical protein